MQKNVYCVQVVSRVFRKFWYPRISMRSARQKHGIYARYLLHLGELSASIKNMKLLITHESRQLLPRRRILRYTRVERI